MDNKTNASPELLPQGVADPEGHTGYVAVSGGIDALGLADGSLLWHTGAASRPLLATGGRLIAQAQAPGQPNAWRILVLDARSPGEPLVTSEPVVFPEWVDARPGEGQGFQYGVRLQGEELLLDWQARSRYSGGAPPPPHVLREASRDAAGTARIHLGTGRVTMEEAPPSAAPSRSVILQESALPPASPDILWQTESWQAGDRSASLALEQAGGELALLLETQGAGDAGQRTELARGAVLTPSVSLDGRHVLVEPAGGEGGLRPWWIFDAATGRRVATVPHEPGASEPSVVGERLLYLVQPPETAPGGAVQRVLKARDLKSGGLLWERPLAAFVAKAPRLPQ